MSNIMKPNQAKVSLVVAITVDGFIARSAGDRSTRWTSVEDSQFYQKFTSNVDLMIVGQTTFQTILKHRPNAKYLVLTTHSDLVERKLALDRLKPNQSQVEAWPRAFSPKQAVSWAEKQGFRRIAIIGGSSVYTQFLQAGLINEIWLTIEPVIFGKGISLFNQTMKINYSLQLLTINKLNDRGTIQCHYQVAYL